MSAIKRFTTTVVHQFENEPTNGRRHPLCFPLSIGDAMRRLNKKQQRERIERLAPELARSGRFGGWLAIEHHFRFEEGMPEARHALDNERIREQLDRLCKEA